MFGLRLKYSHRLVYPRHLKEGIGKKKWCITFLVKLMDLHYGSLLTQIMGVRSILIVIACLFFSESVFNISLILLYIKSTRSSPIESVMTYSIFVLRLSLPTLVLTVTVTSYSVHLRRLLIIWWRLPFSATEVSSVVLFVSR